MFSSLTRILRRRRWRFGLRTFLVAFTVVSVGFAWKVDQVRNQRAAVEWVRSQNGYLLYDFEFSDILGELPDPAPPGPAWLRSLVGVDYLARPVQVSLDCVFGANRVDDVRPLARLTSLRELSLSGALIQDVAPLSQLRRLSRLSLAGAPVSDLSPLVGLASLRELDLSGTTVHDLTPLQHMPKLELVRLLGTPVSEDAVAELQRARPTLIVDF